VFTEGTSSGGVDAGSRVLRALVVDDEINIRRLVSSALSNEGFLCDVAEEGEQAWRMISESPCPYDLVVTDLIMPGRHGHSLATQILTLVDRPVLVVLTGFTEPRIAKDLIARGIDDIVFKPLPFIPFAAKMRALVGRRKATSRVAAIVSQTAAPLPEANAEATKRSRSSAERLRQVPPEEFEERMRKLSRIPPISQAAVEVFKLAIDPQCEFRQLAGAAQRDPALIADILRLANSSFFNPTGKKIVEVERAVVRLGQKRVGELALSSAAFASISKENIPFFSLDAIWRKCMGAGICMEMLLEQIPFDAGSVGGLFCAAVLQPMGRIMVASVFPEIYERMLKQSEQDRRPLVEHEAYVFPVSIGETATKVLASWGIPDEIHRPLRYTSMSYGALSTLNDPMRRRVELVKAAVLLGELATAKFDPWDSVDPPPTAVLKRLAIQSIDPLIAQCRDDLSALVSFGSQAGLTAPDTAVEPVAENRLIAYKPLNVGNLDFLPHYLNAGGMRVVSVADEISDADETVIVNSLNTAVPQIIARLRSPALREAIILADAENAERLQSYGRIVELPISYGALNEICTAASYSAATSPLAIGG